MLKRICSSIGHRSGVSRSSRRCHMFRLLRETCSVQTTMLEMTSSCSERHPDWGMLESRWRILCRHWAVDICLFGFLGTTDPHIRESSRSKVNRERFFNVLKSRGFSSGKGSTNCILAKSEETVQTVTDYLGCLEGSIPVTCRRWRLGFR